MRFGEVTEVSAAVAATRSRTAKTAHIAALLQLADHDELPIVATWMAGELRQQRLGVGWASVFRDDFPASDPAARPLDVADVDTAFSQLAGTSGEGSQGRRREILDQLFRRASEPESALLRSMLTGDLRQGALAGVVLDAIAKAFDVDAQAVRRAQLLCGDLGETATTARAGLAALMEVRLELGRALQPMLATTAASVAEAVRDLGRVSVEWKLDGARVQVHRNGDDVRIFTRNLNDITHRLPDVVEGLRSLPVRSVVLDGEVLGVDDAGRPGAFQETMSRFGTESASAPAVASHRLSAYFFDCLHVDGRDLLDDPLSERLAELHRIVGVQHAPLHCVPGVVTDDVDEALTVQSKALSRGHEGVMVKAADSTYDAGRRGSSWRKVKPVRTFDLVVLAAEWGHGRRHGWLSNLHLGARDETTGGFVMVGKTFKGLTDALLAWQTEALQAIESRRTPGTVWVRPELVVEIALDGVQHSTRYPGGVALRFARVKGYRPDKSASEADTVGALRALPPTPYLTHPTAAPSGLGAQDDLGLRRFRDESAGAVADLGLHADRRAADMQRARRCGDST